MAAKYKNIHIIKPFYVKNITPPHDIHEERPKSTNVPIVPLLEISLRRGS